MGDKIVQQNSRCVKSVYSWKTTGVQVPVEAEGKTLATNQTQTRDKRSRLAVELEQRVANHIEITIESEADFAGRLQAAASGEMVHESPCGSIVAIDGEAIGHV